MEMIKKADAGDADSQAQVACYIMFDDMNEHVDPDWLERALDYFERAAAQENLDAMIALGHIYSRDCGIELDLAKSTYWYRKLADKGSDIGYQALIYNLTWLWPNMPPSYFEPYNSKYDYKTLFEYSLKGALLQNADSMMIIGDMFFAGWHAKEDKKMALSLYNEAYYNDVIYNPEHNSYGDLALRLGECCYKGIVEEQNVEKAHDYFQKALQSVKKLIQEGMPIEFYEGCQQRTQALLEELESGKVYKPEAYEKSGELNAEKPYETGLEYFQNDDWEECFLHFSKSALIALIDYNPSVLVNAIGMLAPMFKEGIYVEKDEKFADKLIAIVDEYGERVDGDEN